MEFAHVAVYAYDRNACIGCFVNDRSECRICAENNDTSRFFRDRLFKCRNHRIHIIACRSYVLGFHAQNFGSDFGANLMVVEIIEASIAGYMDVKFVRVRFGHCEARYACV